MRKSRKHALGQHFLHNQRVIEKIGRGINPGKDDFIIEIGAGRGALTSLLVKNAGKVIAIEKDESLIVSLQKLKSPNLTILNEDFLYSDLSRFVKGQKFKLVGNLPYSLSSRILFKALAEKNNLSECHFLLQKEVAERVCAPPGSKKYAPISILFYNFFLNTINFTIAPGSFQPPPKVYSSFISLIKRESPIFILKDESHFKSFLTTAFGQRRKKLSNNLKALNFPQIQIEQALNITEINGNLRPEQVTLEQFVNLFNQLQ